MSESDDIYDNYFAIVALQGIYSSLKGAYIGIGKKA